MFNMTATELVVTKELIFVVTIRIKDALTTRVKDESGCDTTYGDSGQRLMEGIMSALSSMPDTGEIDEVVIGIVADGKPRGVIVHAKHG